MTPAQYEFHLTELRNSGRFVFAYQLTPQERLLPVDQQKAAMKLHAIRNIDAFFSNVPICFKQDGPDRY